MTRWFNVSGQCNPDDHYMLPATARLPNVLRLIAQKQYFVLHAPRQTGKSTAMWSLARDLTASGDYVAALVSASTVSPSGCARRACSRLLSRSWQAQHRWIFHLTTSALSLIWA